MSIEDIMRAYEARRNPRGHSAKREQIKALFENSDNLFDRNETVLDDEDETEDTDDDRV